MKRAGKRDEAVDSTRTMLWFEHLGQQLGSSSPTVLQRTIAPALEIDAYGGDTSNPRFSNYLKGVYVPRKWVVDRAEAQFPGSAAILNHVLWDILKPANPVQETPRLWAGLLPIEVQRAIVTDDNQFGDNPRTINMLVRRPSLDSLAALTLVFRVYQDDPVASQDPSSQQARQAWEYSLAILDVLLIIGSQFITDQVRNAIFSLYCERVFQHAQCDIGKPMSHVNFDYARATVKLQKLITERNIKLTTPLPKNDLSLIRELMFQVS